MTKTYQYHLKIFDKVQKVIELPILLHPNTVFNYGMVEYKITGFIAKETEYKTFVDSVNDVDLVGLICDAIIETDKYKLHIDFKILDDEG